MEQFHAEKEVKRSASPLKKKSNVWKSETIGRFIANEKPLCDRLKKCSPHMEIGCDIHPEERKYG